MCSRRTAARTGQIGDAGAESWVDSNGTKPDVATPAALEKVNVDGVVVATNATLGPEEAVPWFAAINAGDASEGAVNPMVGVTVPANPVDDAMADTSNPLCISYWAGTNQLAFWYA